MKFMNNMFYVNPICFSDNREKIEARFKDYMNHYYVEIQGQKGLSYDTSKTFQEKDKEMNRTLLSEISKHSGINMDNTFSKKVWSTNPMLQWYAFAVVNQMIDMILPDTINRTIGLYTETRFVDWGDSMLFEVESNDLFYVSKHGRAQRTVEFQRQYNGQASVIPENREMTVVVSMYKVLCGIESLAKFVAKAIISLETQITKEVYQAFDTAMATLPTTPAGGELNITGWDEEEVIRLADTVTAFNNSSRAMLVGTKLALRNIMPEDANYRYWLDDTSPTSYMRLGYVPNFKGIDVMMLPQIADWENPYHLALRNDVIYVVSPVGKPVKLVYEGGAVTRTLPYEMAANKDETTTIEKSYGIGIATNAIAGVINL
jgi:hypothetical protein